MVLGLKGHLIFVFRHSSGVFERPCLMALGRGGKGVKEVHVPVLAHDFPTEVDI